MRIGEQPPVGAAMPALIAPTGGLRTAWLEAHGEWGPGVHEDGFGLLETDDVESPAGFEAWLVLVMCEAGNIASAKTIESRGGVPAKPGNAADESAWRYWIQL